MKKTWIRKCLSHKRLHAVTLAGSLLLLSVLSYLPARVHAKSTYTMQQVIDDNISLKNNDTVLISGKEDLELLDQYLEAGKPVFQNTTFYQTCDIALTDYTFSTVQDNDKSLIKIYHSSTEKCEAVFDASSNKFYTDDSCQTESDFSFQGDPWSPIGSAAHPFMGHYEGNQYAISGLWNNAVLSSVSKGAVGFFDHMKNAAISNLNLCDSFINVRYTNDAGQNATETISNNCTNNLGVMTTVAEETTFECCNISNITMNIKNIPTCGIYAGMFAGSTSGTNDGRTFDTCTVTNTMINIASRNYSSGQSLPANMIGMFTGDYQHDSSLDQYDTFTNCNSDGLIRDATHTSLVGGICGKTTQNVLFLQCVNNTIIRNANMAGGILGFCSSSNTDPESTLTNDTQLYSCQNNAEITGAHIGGILGMSGFASSSWSAVIDKCSNTGNLNAYQNAGGILMESHGHTYIANCNNSGAIFQIADSSQDAYTNIRCSNNANEQVCGLKISAIGGLAGWIITDYDNAPTSTVADTIYNSYNTGSLTTLSSADAGGLIGHCFNQFTMENCYNSGSVSHDKENGNTSTDIEFPSSNTSQTTRPIFTGGLIGHNSSSSSANVRYCYNAADIDPLSNTWQYDYFSGDPNPSLIPLDTSKCYQISKQQLTASPNTADITAIDADDDLYSNHASLTDCLNSWVESENKESRAGYAPIHNIMTADFCGWTSDGTDSPSLNSNISELPRLTHIPASPVPLATATTDPTLIPSEVPAPPATTTPEISTTPNVPASSTPEILTTPNVSVSSTPEVSTTPNVSVSVTPKVSTTPNVFVSSTPEVSATPVTPATSTPAATAPVSNPNDAPVSRSLTLRAGASRNGGILLSWSCDPDQESFVVYRRLKNKPDFSLVTALNTGTKGFTQKLSGNTQAKYTFTDKKAKPNKTYYYKILSYTKNGTVTSSTSVKAVSRLRAPTITVRQKKTAPGVQFLQIRLSKYQGRYAGIYIRKNNGKYVYIRMKNNKISPRRKTFNFRHSMRNVTLSVRVRTYQTKKRKKGSFYSKVKKVRIR